MTLRPLIPPEEPSRRSCALLSAALERLVQEGYSLAYGARFLKRVIDERIKLPISQRWKDAKAFRATLRGAEVVVEAAGPRLMAAHPDAVAV